MSNKTQTVRNGGGEGGPRDVVWGPEVKKVVAAVISLLVAILGWSIVDRLTMEHRVTAVERGDFTSAQKEFIQDSIDLAVLKAASSDNYVKHDEWAENNADVAARLLENQRETREQIRSLRREFKDDARHNRSILEKLPGAREDDDR